MADDTWKSLLGSARPCECGQTHVVATREVVIESGAIERVGEVLGRHVAGSHGAVVADANTWDVAGGRVARLLGDRHIAEVVLEPQRPGDPLKADDEALAGLMAALPSGAEFVVCVGSGVLNDLSKLAAGARRVPSVCVATAPSMNGYPSAIAAIARGGIKITESCEPPVAILCDTDVLARAPEEMVQAGLGDLLSKSTSATDWLMAHTITGEHYCARPVDLVEDAERGCAENAAAIGRRESWAIELLMSGLIQSGISMAMAGASSPASGGEHLISHYWDMTAGAHGRKPDLHGRQVAVATVACAKLYESMQEATADGIDVAGLTARRISDSRLRDESLAHFAPLLGSDTAARVADLLLSKHMTPERLAQALVPLAADPQAFWRSISRLLRPASRLREIYSAAGVPTTPGEIGVSPEQMRAAFLYGRHIRSRYTILDLAADVELLDAVD